MKIGKPGVNNKKFVKKNYFSILKGTQTYRILPPLGDLADRGIWNVYYATHFGYKNTQGYMKVFQSPEVYNRKTKMVDVADEAKERIKRLQGQKAKLTERLAESPSPLLEEQLAKIDAELRTYNLEKRFYVNAINQNGEIGLLKLKSREKAAVEAARKTIEQDENIDPVGVDGCFLTFSKTGDGAQESVVSVTMSMRNETIGNRTVKIPNTHTVDESMIPRLEKEAFDLSKLFVKPTAEEVALIVKDGAPAVDVVFEKYKTPYQKPVDAVVSAPASYSNDDNGAYDDEVASPTSDFGPPPVYGKESLPEDRATVAVSTEETDEEWLQKMLEQP